MPEHKLGANLGLLILCAHGENLQTFATVAALLNLPSVQRVDDGWATRPGHLSLWTHFERVYAVVKSRHLPGAPLAEHQFLGHLETVASKM